MIAWEYAVNRNVAWVQGRTYPRVVGFGALSNVLIPSVVFILGASFGDTIKLGFISPFLYVATSVAALYYYPFRRPDLLMLAMTGAAVLAARWLLLKVTASRIEGGASHA